MQHEIHAADAQHGHAGITVIAGKGFLLREVPLLLCGLATDKAVRPTFLIILEVALVGMGLKEILPGIHEESAGTSRWVDNTIARFWPNHLHHHSNDVPRRTELAICTGSIEAAK